jgi:hypothetical protein
MAPRRPGPCGRVAGVGVVFLVVVALLAIFSGHVHHSGYAPTRGWATRAYM